MELEKVDPEHAVAGSQGHRRRNYHIKRSTHQRQRLFSVGRWKSESAVKLDFFQRNEIIISLHYPVDCIGWRCRFGCWQEHHRFGTFSQARALGSWLGVSSPGGIKDFKSNYLTFSTPVPSATPWALRLAACQPV